MKNNVKKLSEATMKQLIREVEELSVWELVLAYCECKGGHVMREHVQPSWDERRILQECVKRAYAASRERKTGTRRRLHSGKYGEPVEQSAFSMFTISTDEIANAISKCLMENIEEVALYVANGCGGDKDFYLSFEKPIGIGILEQGDWDKSYLFSGICVVITDSNVRGRLFQVKTAYPVLSDELRPDGLSELDDAYNDLVDYYFKRHPEMDPRMR